MSRVFLVTVPDDYERLQTLDALAAFLGQSAHRFTGADFNQRAFSDQLQTTSLFEGEPVTLLDEIEKLSKKEAQQLPTQLSYGYLIYGSRSKTPLAASIEKEGFVLDLLEEKPWDKEKRLAAELQAKASSAGKTLSPEVIPLLFDRLDKDSGLLESELEKLICYTGDESRIAAEHVLAITSISRTHTFWQMAEELIWEGIAIAPLDDAAFHPLLPSLRSQLQLGLKIAALLETGTAREEWSQVLGRVYPKTLEKRTSQAARLGQSYFARGLKTLFEIELASRNNSTSYAALLDLFRTRLATYAPR